MGEVGMAVQKCTNKGSGPRDSKVHVSSLLLFIEILTAS